MIQSALVDISMCDIRCYSASCYTLVQRHIAIIMRVRRCREDIRLSLSEANGSEDFLHCDQGNGLIRTWRAALDHGCFFKYEFPLAIAFPLNFFIIFFTPNAHMSTQVNSR
jgi:hypothetical protein